MNVAFFAPTDLRCGIFSAPITTSPAFTQRYYRHCLCAPRKTRTSSRTATVRRRRRSPLIPSATATKSSSSSTSSSGAPWPSSSPSTALNYDNKNSHSVSRFIDLRTMEVILPEDAHLDPMPPSGFSFSPVPEPEKTQPSSSASTSSTYRQHTQTLSQMFFTSDTIPLSDSQREAVEALLSHRSVIYASPSPDDKFLLFLDIVMRSRVWRKRVVYCASSRRVAETMFTTLLAQLGSERRHEIYLDFNEATDSDMNQKRPSPSFNESSVRVVITSPEMLRNALVDIDETTHPSWIKSTSIIFIDNVTDSSLTFWEETFLSIPSSIQLCLMSNHLTRAHLELLPIWIENIQSTTSLVASCSSSFSSYPSTILNRIERPHQMPLLRTFAYNAASHKSPVQVSLTILKELLVNEIEDENNIPDFAKAFLYGVTSITAEDPKELLFRSANEAAYADIASLVIADARKTENAMKTRSRRRSNGNSGNSSDGQSKKSRKTKRKAWSATSRAAARRRRETAFQQSMLMPAIVLVKGHEQTIDCAQAIEASLGAVQENDESNSSDTKSNVNLVWDEDSKNHISFVIDSFLENNISSDSGRSEESKTVGEELTAMDTTVLQLLRNGVGVINDLMTSSIRIVVEELFRSGLIPLLVADTHLGSDELLSIPCAKSILVEAGCLSACDDKLKGLLAYSTVASLCGRRTKDDVGNLIFVWYDNEVDDEHAGYQIANDILSPELLSMMSASSSSPTSRVSEVDFLGFGATPLIGDGVESIPVEQEQQEKLTFDQFDVRRGIHTRISCSYDSVLRCLQRFGVDGTEILHEYNLSSFKHWLKRAAVHATLEKMNVEKTAIDERLSNEDWSKIKDYQLKTARMNESKRLLNAMKTRVAKVLEAKMLVELQKSPPGRIIGIKLQPETNSKKLLSGDGDTSPDADKDKTDELNQSELQEDQEIGKDDYKSGRLTYGVFVTIFDQDAKSKRPVELDHQYLVVCIMADGLWTMIPLHQIVSISEISYEDNYKYRNRVSGSNSLDEVNDIKFLSEESEDENKIIPNVDLLEMPHPATFDVEQGYEIAKSLPVDESEESSINRVSDALISRIANETIPKLIEVQIDEFESQRAHFEKMEQSQKRSPWYGRDDELTELKRLRRRSAQISDNMDVLRRRKLNFENEIKQRNDNYKSVQTSLMAVLEDCHALLFTSPAHRPALSMGHDRGYLSVSEVENDFAQNNNRTLDNDGEGTDSSVATPPMFSEVSNTKAMGIDMTPIGSFAGALPCEFPLFAAACLCLAEGLGDLSEAEMAAFIGVIIGGAKTWPVSASVNGLTFDDEEDENGNNNSTLPQPSQHIDQESDDVSYTGSKSNNNIDSLSGDELLSQLNGGASTPAPGRPIQNEFDDLDDNEHMTRAYLNSMEGASEEDKRREFEAEMSTLGKLLPGNLAEFVIELKQALRQLHARHLTECAAARRVYVADVVPPTLNHRLGSAAALAAQPSRPWPEVVDALAGQGGYAVRELRNVRSTLRLAVNLNEELGLVFDDRAIDVATRTLQGLDRWPLVDEHAVQLIMDTAVVDKQWPGNTYEKWWRSVKDEVRQMQQDSDDAHNTDDSDHEDKQQ